MKNNPWLPLALVLVLCAPPLLVRVAAPDPVRIMESLSFMTSQETWLRMHGGETDAWKMPSWNGEPRVQKPPMLVWMNLLAWRGLAPETAGVDELTARARVLSAGFALLTIAATFWAGMTLGGIRPATLGALITGSSLLFIRQSRIASYDTHLMGWVTLAVAAGLSALSAGDSSRPRAAARWLLALFALVAACCTKGPLAFALVLAPLLARVATRPPPRSRGAAAVLALGAAAACAMIPWFVTATRAMDGSTVALDREYSFIVEAFHNPFHYVGVLALVFPWTIWLAAALVESVADRTARADRAQRFAWLWFVVLFILFTLSPVKNKRYIVPILPAAGILTAFLWLRLADAVARPRWAAAWRIVHGVVLAAGSVLLPAFILLQDRLLKFGVIGEAVVADLPAALPALAFVALGTLAALEIRAHARGDWTRAGLLTAVWMLAAATLGFAGYARAGHQRYAHRDEAEALALLTGRTNLFFISEFEFPMHQARPGDEFLIFYRGIVPETDAAAVRAWTEQGRAFHLITRVPEEQERELAGLGLRYRFDLNDGRPPDWKVWTFDPARE